LGRLRTAEPKRRRGAGDFKPECLAGELRDEGLKIVDVLPLGGVIAGEAKGED
jgi:hypothetical protein